MRITAARFLGAAGPTGGAPPPGPPEIAIGGRSNVGKSSLINCLVGRRGLARASQTPGRTRQLNFFLLNERFAIVDLPGYGFAVGPEAEQRAWGPLVDGYLRERPTLRGFVLVVDARRGVETEEEQVLAFAADAGLPAVVAARGGAAGMARGARAADRILGADRGGAGAAVARPRRMDRRPGTRV